jgi:hypothetical protein
MNVMSAGVNVVLVSFSSSRSEILRYFGIYPVVPDFPHETLCYRSLSHFLRSVEQHPDAERIALVPMLDSIPAFPVRAEQTSRPL